MSDISTDSVIQLIDRQKLKRKTQIEMFTKVSSVSLVVKYEGNIDLANSCP